MIRGRLLGAGDVPAREERTEMLVRTGNASIEQILSGELEGPVDYRQDHDEWVVVLAGAAVLEVGGERAELGAGDWVLLPAGTPHRLVEVTPGTNWLAVHLREA